MLFVGGPRFGLTAVAVVLVEPGVASPMDKKIDVSKDSVLLPVADDRPSPAAKAPPRVPFVLSLGVTGHRPDLLRNELGDIDRRLELLFADIVAAARDIAAEYGKYFADAPPRITLVSPLAEGADQAAARVAVDLGIELQAVLPFARDDYEQDFPSETGRARFRELLGEARCVLELPGQRAAKFPAYVMAGRATIAHCDLLVAVWDGQEPRGRGGTGEVVEIALLAGTPIVHVPVDPEAPISLLWSEFDPHVYTTRQNSMTASRPFDRATLDAVLRAILAPPPDPSERDFLLTYYGERERRINPRVEYPVVLALTGVSRIKRSNFRAPSFATTVASAWSAFREGCDARHGVSTDLDPLRDAYCWSAQLARRFAQTYRSGHVFNFMVAAIAVLIALSGLVLSNVTLLLPIIELVLIIAIIANTNVGIGHGWHRRWLDYRQLAERLRPMRSLKLLGIAAPLQPNSTTADRRWIDWYAAGIWRAMGCPHGAIRNASELAEALATHELKPQIDYHREAALQAERFDHRLHLIGNTLFVATVVGCLTAIVGYFVAPDWIADRSNLLVFLSGGLPAVGTAIFGIRVQGDFSATAARSRSTSNRLEGVAGQINGLIDLPRAADLFEQAARAMHADLGEWRLAHAQRELFIPG